MLQLRRKAMNFLWYSLTLDESTILSSTSQHLVFIRGVNLDFYITEDLVSVCSMHGTTTGNTCSWKCRKLCNTITFRGISVNVLQLMEEKAWLEWGSFWWGRSGLSWKIFHSRALYLFTAIFISKHSVGNTYLNISCVRRPAFLRWTLFGVMH